MMCFAGPTPEELIEIQRVEAEKQVLLKCFIAIAS